MGTRHDEFVDSEISEINRIARRARNKERTEHLMPGGIPRWIRVYDNGGKSGDRYTVVYTRTGHLGTSFYVGMSSNPFHPQGIGQHGESRFPIDRPTYSHLGKRITFEALPPDCKKLVLRDYKDIWGIA